MSRICVSILRCNPITTRPSIPTTIIRTRTLFNSRALSFPQPHKNDSSSAGLQSYKGDQQISADVRPIGEKVKETAKTTSYLGVILLGVGVTGAMFFTIFKELFSSQSPNNIYAKALDQCISDTRVEDLLGAPIKGFGEESRRGRRGHVSHSLFMQNGVKHLRMRFYIKGSRNKATVHLEMEEVSALTI